MHANPGVGGYGGTCLCPDGRTYEVGDNNDHCKTIQCVNGEMINCNHKRGIWSERKVTCAGNLKLAYVVLRYYYIVL